MWSPQAARQRRRRAAAGEAQLLSGAAEVITRRGLERTRLADVAQATGTAVSTLQYLFGSRENLLLSVIEYVTEAEIRQVQEIATSAADARDRLYRLLALAVDEGGIPGDVRCFRYEVTRAAQFNTEIRALAVRAYDVWLETLRSILQDGIDLDLLELSTDARGAAAEILALFDGFARPLLLGRMDAESARELGSNMLAALLSGRPPLPGIA
ncbi:MAG TPA: helix-turn-helix domain-containing protein [Chloroflexota bacterium]|nr:helix-turn-helix domain-containing protein [Chloroflexota bacterium]